MSRYIPVRFYPDRMPVDISYVFENERPAGKHGFCKTSGDKLAFEDGTPARFWGVIFNGACCFPTHEYAEGVAIRLAQAGCNIVRFHQMDAEWATPNIFRLTAGKRLKDTRHFDPVCMERHDYLIKCLKEQGIYIATDITTYRKFKSGDGVHDADLLSDNMKGVALYDPLMIELQKEYACNYWNHVNQYTGVAYKDDPQFVLLDITNENDLFSEYKGHAHYGKTSKYYDDMFRDMFAEWLAANGIDYDAYGCPIFNKDKPMLDFRIHLSKKYYEGMYRYLREEIGIKIPICGTNWAKMGGLVKSQENMDFQDGHHYYYDWKWGEFEKTTFNRTLTELQTSRLAACSATRIHGQPFIMTEWDMPWPNSHRAEAPIWFPATAMLQGWSAMMIHTYAYGFNLSPYDILGKEATSSTIGSVPYREGIFTCWNDPSKFGLFYHGALMMRRGDIKQANKTIGARITNYGSGACVLPATAMEVHRVDSVLDTTDISDLEDVRPIEEAFKRNDPNLIVSDTGELWRNVAKRIGAVDTPNTKALYGFLGNAVASKTLDESILLNGMKVKCNTDFATIALSSLTDEPIQSSDCMLLSTIGRSRSKGAQFDGEKLLDFGTGPIEVEVIDAEIAIRTDREGMRVWSVNSDGYYVGQIPKTYEDGWLKFRVGPNFAGMYYLIMQE
ncbi:MAG: hypothetical protein IJN63_02855 [Clostridia bacterium]|nr:hypothetical protein [Clostridia bacterium]